MTGSLPVLNDRFRGDESFRDRTGRRYALLPMRLISLDPGRYVLTNFAGEHIVLQKETVRRLVHHELDMTSHVYDELKSKHFLLDGDSSAALDLLTVKYRTKQSLLAEFTSLFMYVVTLRCDHSCPYCQVSRQSADRQAYDMKPDVAEKAIDFMFRSPSKSVKVEFQGGEPLLNFSLVRQIVERVKFRNESEGRRPPVRDRHELGSPDRRYAELLSGARNFNIDKSRWTFRTPQPKPSASGRR